MSSMFTTPIPVTKPGRKERRPAYDQKYNNTHRGSGRPFVGCDGEGGNGPDAKHGYYLLRIGEHCLYRDGKPLTTLECLSFIYRTCDTQSIYVGYFFNYDVTMIMQDAPWETKQALANRTGRIFIDNDGKEQCRWVPYGPFQLDYIPGKYFRVRLEGFKKSVTVNDVSGYFQTSFVKALKDWNIGAQHLEAIQKGKESRSSLTGTYTPEDIEYNRLECELLAELMGAVRRACEEANIRPSSWQGAGTLAQALLKREDAPRNVVLPEGVKEYAQGAYYGGRFEIACHGNLPVSVWENDIASAYPAALLSLPCLRDGHGTWTYSDSIPFSTDYYVAKLAWSTNRTNDTLGLSPMHSWGPYPYRTRAGRIHYPLAGNGWYWSPEIQAAARLNHIKTEIISTWSYHQLCECEPYNWVNDVFEERKKIGKTAKGKILKLGMNSLYGKTAQSVGTAAYANPVYAGLITSITRARMLDIIASGVRVVMIATDGIYTLDPIPQDAFTKWPDRGDTVNLGDWECKEFPGAFLIQPGVYWCGSTKVATRGIPKRVVEEKLEDIRSAWYRDGFNGEVQYTRNQFYGMRLATHLNETAKYGQWETVPRTITFASNAMKRQLPSVEPGQDYAWSTPLDRDPEKLETTPYKRIIGGGITDIAMNELLSEQPEFEDSECEKELGLL